jgi:hypothetical protein
MHGSASRLQRVLPAGHGLTTRVGPGDSSRGMPHPAQPSFARELWDFLRVRKKWWLGPIVLVLVLFGALVVLTQGSAVAPFIYTIF